MLFLSEYHIFPIRNNVHAIFQALTAFTSWQRSDWDSETQISGVVSGENPGFISLSIIIKHTCLQSGIYQDTSLLLFPSFFLPYPGVYVLACLFLYTVSSIHCHCVFLYFMHCILNVKGHCNYYHYYHKHNLCVYAHTRRTYLIESISFADDGFTFCHGGCCLISMVWKYGFIFWANLSCIYLICSWSPLFLTPAQLSLRISLTLSPPAEKWW